MTLHSRLHAVIAEQVELARAIADRYGIDWTPDPDGGESVESEHGWVVTPAYEDADDLRQFIAANDPARVIRQCERDLRVLERHAREPNILSRSVCSACAPYDWPCVEIRELAAALSVPVEEG